MLKATLLTFTTRISNILILMHVLAFVLIGVIDHKTIPKLDTDSKFSFSELWVPLNGPAWHSGKVFGS